jgi:uncharacterized protein (TIGR03437 family)
VKHLTGLALLLGINALNAVAQSPGSFVRIASMTNLRWGHTATLLRDGRVLIAGGQNSSTLTTAELYDPSSGTFVPTGNMTVARAWHASTLLSDGRVLIAGGGQSNGLTSAELYDPRTGTFTATGNMSAPHLFPAVNLLSNGKVLITGSTSAELYDPATGVFTPAGVVSEGTGGAVLLRGSRVLIPGYDSISLYSITADSLKLLASLPGTLKGFHTSTLLANGKVLIAGGQVEEDHEPRDSEASLYDPRSGTLEGTGFLLTGRWGHTANLLTGGRVLFAGGYNGGYVAFAEEYDPATGSFTSLGVQASFRSFHTATVLLDGRVLIAGGSTTPPAEIYTPALRAASTATLTGPLAPESLGSLFGSRLALVTATADPLPLPAEDEVPPSAPTSLGGISVRLRDSAGATRLAPLYYVSPSRIDFEVPAGTAPGDFTLDVLNGPTQFPSVTGQIRNVAPGLLTLSDGTPDAYALRIEPNQTWTILPARNTIVLDDRPVYLILYATGTRNHSSVANVRCVIGGTSLPVEYAGPSGAVPGLDQVNVRLTSALKGLGVANLVMTVDGIPSNTVSVDIR